MKQNLSARNEIIEKLLDYHFVNSRAEAEAWIEDEIPAALGKTPADLIADGHADVVLSYLEGVFFGGYE